MLVPLNRYFQTLVPTLSPNPSPSLGPGAGGIKPFSIPSFLSHLKTKGPNPLTFRNKGLTSRTRVENDFYTSFCMSPTFAGWLASRVDSLGLAVAAQSQTLSVPANTSAYAGKKTVGLGIGDTPSFADLSVSDGASSRRVGGGSPTQWSSDVSESERRTSSDGSSLGQGQWMDDRAQSVRRW